MSLFLFKIHLSLICFILQYFVYNFEYISAYLEFYSFCKIVTNISDASQSRMTERMTKRGMACVYTWHHQQMYAHWLAAMHVLSISSGRFGRDWRARDAPVQSRDSNLARVRTWRHEDAR